MESERVDTSARFSLVAGGPFYRLMQRLGLIEADGLSGQRAAIIIALFAWLFPAILAAAQSLADARHLGWGYFTDLTVPARFLIAIWAMIITERYADSRFVILARQFRKTLLARENQAPFEAALVTADRRSSSAWAEGLLLAAAFVSIGLSMDLSVSITGSSWEGSYVDDHTKLSWAGVAVRYVSGPLFLFLVLRWAWWFLVWAALLFRVSRLSLQLIPSHPDRAAGLGFLAIYPSVFSGVVFALSCVISTAILKDLAFEKHPPDLIWFAIAGWIAINLLVFLGPLLVFISPMQAAQEQALLDYGRLATRQHQMMYRKWIENADHREEDHNVRGLPPMAELNLSIQSIRDMSISPINRSAVMGIILASGIPMLAVVLKIVPLNDLLKWAVGKIL